MCLYACVRLYGGATVFHCTARVMGRMLVRLLRSESCVEKSTCRPALPQGQGRQGHRVDAGLTHGTRRPNRVLPKLFI